MMKRIILILALFVSALANAQTYGGYAPPGTQVLLPQNVVGPYSTYFPPGQTGFVPSSGTSVGTSTGVTVGVAGDAIIMKDGTQYKIPASISSSISKGAVGAVAVAAWKIATKSALGPLGLAITGWQIYQALKDEPWFLTCPAPDFVCKPAPVPPPTYPKAYYRGPLGVNYNDVDSAGNAAVATIKSNNNCTSSPNQSICSITKVACSETLTVWTCSTTNSEFYPNVSNSKIAIMPSACAAPKTLVGDMCVSPPLPPIPATEPDIQNAGAGGPGSAGASDSSGAAQKKYWDAANADWDKAQAQGLSPGESYVKGVMVPEGSPTVVTAPPVTLPKKTTSTEDFKDANGVPQTRTTEQTTTVTPTSSGTGSGTSITYNTSNVTTTTTTNNTSTSTSNPPTVSTTTASGTPAAAPQINLPTDYNREVTQQKIADELAATNAPAAPADQEARQKTAVDKTNTDLDTSFKGIPNAFTTDKANWFSWVWTPPVGVCNAADYSGTVHGYGVTFDICPWVAKIRDALGWLFTLFGALVIYGQIFKGNE